MKSEDVRGERGEAVTSDLGRQLRCAAYNALVAVITCTQTDEKFFRAFLFTEKPQQVAPLSLVTHSMTVVKRT